MAKQKHLSKGWVATRDEVYEAINSERDYQDKKWGGQYDDSLWSVGDWIIFMERYIEEAKSRLGYENVMYSIRKIGALAVAAMEYKGAPRRKA